MLIRSAFLPIVLDWVVARGSEPVADGIRRELDLPEPSGNLLKMMTVPLPVFHAAGSLFAERLNEPFLGLQLAREIPRGSYGIVEYAARNAPDIGEALDRVVRFMSLVSDPPLLELRKADDEFSLVHRIAGEPLCTGRHANEFTLALFHRFVRDASQEPVRPVRVEFAHPAPEGSAEVEAFFDTTSLHFSAGRNRLTYENRVLSLPNVAGNGQLLPWLDSYAESLLAAEHPPRIPGLHEQLRRSLQLRTTPSLADVASRMQLSTRTLQRRLQNAHTSFQKELEEVRGELAESHLRDPKLNIYEIAVLLGYADRSGFERAFVKRRGMTPGEFRRKMAQS